jgi:phage FluMu protein Com
MDINKMVNDIAKDIVNELIGRAIKEAIEEEQQDYVVVKCPHCKDVIMILKKEFNCRIFRHGYYKDNNVQMNAHEHKEECDRLFNEGLIYGCGKPFRLNEKNVAIVCEYI